MTHRHALERIDFFNAFADKMSPGKHPKHKLDLYKKRLAAATERVDKFRSAYAKKRADAKGRRAERVATARSAREHDKELSKPLKAVFAKARRVAEVAAQKAAIRAIKELEAGGTSSKKSQMVAGLKAYEAAHEAALKDILEKGEREASSDSEDAEKPPTPAAKEALVAKADSVAALLLPPLA